MRNPPKWFLPVLGIFLVLHALFPAIIPYPSSFGEAFSENFELPGLKNLVTPTNGDGLQVNQPARYPPMDTAISTLLQKPEEFHQQLIKTRGIIKQPELHLDDTQLKEHFVFRLTEGNEYVTVFGTHDRTQGAPFIVMNQQVEVVGYFFENRVLNSYPLTNLLEALTVNPYPALEPDRT